MVSEILVDDGFVSDMNFYRRGGPGDDLLKASSENPSYFAEHMVGLRPFSWQVYVMELFRRAVNDRADYMGINISKASHLDNGPLLMDINDREFVIMCSRQIGKTTMMCFIGLWAIVFNKVPSKPFWNTVMNIVSSTDSQAGDVVTEMKNYIRMGDYKMSEYLDADGKSVFGSSYFSDLLYKDKNNATFITLSSYSEKHGDYLLGGRFTPSKSGSFIKSVPPTQKVLGNSPTIGFIDEAGRSKAISDNFINSMFKPAGSRTNALWVYTSTPWSPNGFFYEAVDPDDSYGTDKDFIKPIFTVDAVAIEDKITYEKNLKEIARMNARGKVDDVQRSFYCKFVKGESSYFTPEKVKGSFDKTFEKYSSFDKPCNLGVDFGGQTTSKTVLTLSTVNDDGEVVRIYDRYYSPQKDDNLVDDIRELMKDFVIDRIIVDDCAAGMLFIRMMENEGWDITRMSFRAEKIKKYGAFRRMLNKGLVKSYVDDDLRTEMLAMEYAGNTRQSYIQHAPGYSDDLIDSFVMSVYYFCEEENDDKPKFFSWSN